MTELTHAEAELLRWAGSEFKRRTRLVKVGAGKIDWLDPGTRVSWTEITTKAEALGIARKGVDLRTWYDENKEGT
jgi:hypothetical protein